MSNNVLVEPVDSPDDFPPIFHCFSEAFARQRQSSLWMTMNPNWNSTEGQREGALRLLERWQSITKNQDGHANTVILKATLRDPEDGFKHKIVGAAIWEQFSFVEGYGNPPTVIHSNTAALNLTERRFAIQVYRSLWGRRVSLAREKAESDSPAIFTLDICAVDPAFQRRGVGEKLVAWGLEEARRRGGLECTTEASLMGQAIYKRLGFGAEGAENIACELDEEFGDREKPETLFMRTWVGQQNAH
ncbi:putative GNAT family acetyltransferase [Xylariales sp. AK1849]|nr:putative GNAT family acetyltransferase [Xylariales sp. AK1849]